MQHYKVAIVGAGIAGLGAACEFYQCGCDDIIVLEAQSEAGGRIKTISFEDGIIELGAQWIHGTENSLYKLAKKHDLLSTVSSNEAQGLYIRDDGFIFDDYLVKLVDFQIGRILEECEKFINSQNYPCSVGNFLEEEFLKYIKTCNDNKDLLCQKLELFDWHVKFQLIDNSCCNLKDLSAKEWGKYFCLTKNGQAHINFKNGYKSILNIILSSLPNGTIKYNSQVSKIIWKNNVVQIVCPNNYSIDCDHVIVTTSLGLLKCPTSILFEPSLPNKINNTINSMGYYGMGKIFLVFKHKWWNTEGFQLIWRRNIELVGRDSWTQYISGFDLVYNQPNILLGWVAAEGVIAMENLSEEEVGLHCVKLLNRFLKKDIPHPIKIFRTKWMSSPWIRGTYSYITPQCDQSGTGPESLSEPIYNNGVPRILFAGEACNSNNFSTTHGAFESGKKQAKCILDLYNNILPNIKQE